MWRHINERQYRNGLVAVGLYQCCRTALLTGRLLDGCFAGFRKHELVESEVTQGQRQYHHDDAVQLLAGLRGDRLCAVDILLFLQAFRCEFERPGKDQCGNNADGQDDSDGAQGGVTETERRKNRLYHLDDQPRTDNVGSAYAEDITAFEFIKQGQWLTS